MVPRGFPELVTFEASPNWQLIHAAGVTTQRFWAIALERWQNPLTACHILHPN
jgi:hypothetical protein